MRARDLTLRPGRGLRPSRGRGRRRALALAGPLALALGAAHAQPAPEDLRGRTGPNAAPPAAPAYATPHEMAPAAPAPTPRPSPGQGPTLSLADVRVDTDPGVGAGRVRADYRAAVEDGGPRLDARPGEALDAAWVRRQFAFNHLIGAPVTADRVVALVLAINEAYARNGFVNTGLLFARQDWPAAGGVLELRLVTGRVVPLKAGGPAVSVDFLHGHSRGLGRRYVLDRMPAATRTPLDAIETEREFRLLAENPAIRTLNAQLLAAGRPGEATLALSVDPQPRIDAYAGVANSRSPTVGGERVYVGGSLRNLASGGDLLSVEGGLTRGLKDGVVSYSTPVLGPRTIFSIRAAYDEAAVIEPSLRSLDIKANETDIEGGLSQILLEEPLTPRPDGRGWRPAESLIVGVRVAERYSFSSLLGQPFSFAPGAVNGHTDFTVLRASADWVERGERQVIAASVTASFGLDGSGGDLPLPQKVNPNFKALLGQVTYARRLTPGGLEFRARWAGQWADSLVYTPEQFAAGGATTVRGYRENLLLADTGMVGSLELSCPLSIGANPCTSRGAAWKTIRASVFVDGATLKTHFDPQPPGQNLASVGASVVWTPISALFVRLTYGEALIKPLQIGPRDIQDHGFEFEVTIHPLALLRR